MKINLLIICVFFYQIAFAQNPIPHPHSGTVKRFENFYSKFVSSRNVDVWLPANYDTSRRYAVLYMHDGQMLYDSNTTWNKQEWGVDETVTELLKEKKIQDCIVVGIWNTGKGRHADYFPQKPYQKLSDEQKAFISQQLQEKGRTIEAFQPVSDNYLRFLVTELKPFIDKTFATLPSKDHTFVAGSSMGGLISMYAICEYPQIFGGAACLSTHWIGTFSPKNNPIPKAFLDYLNQNTPSSVTHKCYFGYGNQTLDALYPPFQQQADEILRNKGFSAKSWQTRFFEGDDHSEKSWRKRLHYPLEFLLRNEN